MEPVRIVKNGFPLRVVSCKKCGSKLIHPKDEQEYNEFMRLKSKTYKVKMRMVGNSYTISIPKQIVEFMREQERIMDDMVRLCFNEAKKLSLMFGHREDEEEK